MSDTRLDDQRHGQVADDVRQDHVNKQKWVVHGYRASSITRADSPNLDRTHSISVVSPQEVQVHCEVCKEHLNWQGCAWLTVVAMIDHQSEVVDLKDHAEVNQRSLAIAQDHARFGE